MLADIVLLYITFQIALPTWCKILVIFSLFTKISSAIIGFTKGFIDGWNKTE